VGVRAGAEMAIQPKYTQGTHLIHTHPHTHTCFYMHTQTHIYTYTRTYTHTYTHTYTQKKQKTEMGAKLLEWTRAPHDPR